ncbi:DUF3883 domain-containing protein [Candidatus Wolfebacteria bacterium]|nr:DUF3883 domain-containing protein [Candidatus Wolfebacteria bacterium]
MNYFIAPRSGEKSHKNYQSTIKNGVPLKRISKHLDSEEVAILSKEEIVYAWGNRQGTVSSWNKMQDGDLVIFYANKRLVMTGEVYLKKHSPDLALTLWPPDDQGNPWEYVFFIKNMKYISMPISVFNSAVGWKENNVVQGFTYLLNERVKGITDKYGSVEKMLELFTDNNSEEIPLESEKLYVNVPKETQPIIIKKVNLTPKLKTETNTTDKTHHSPKKIDHVARNKKNSITGSKGEELVLSIERRCLEEAGKKDLAIRVSRVSIDDDSLGYDILSFDLDGNKKYIEVKTSVSKGGSVRFYVSLNEYGIGKNKENYFIYFVEDINSNSPTVTIIENPMDDSLFLIKPDGYIFEANR